MGLKNWLRSGGTYALGLAIAPWIFAAAHSASGASNAVSPVALTPESVGVGLLAPPLSLTDIHGHPFQLRSDAGSPVAVVFTSPTCPVSKLFAPSLGALQRQYPQVKFVYVDAFPSDTLAQFKSEIHASGLEGVYAQDLTGRIAKTMGATSSAEVFLLDPSQTIVYRGAVSDQFGINYSKAAPTKNYLADAIAALLAHQTPEVRATTAPGCYLNSSGVPKATAITYTGTIARVVDDRCISCHRPNGGAPFSLTTYRDVVSHADMIDYDVRHRLMPPWFASPVKKGQPDPWSNDASLTSREFNAMTTWAESKNHPEGPANLLPPAPRFPSSWSFGKPDAIFQIPKAQQIPAQGVLPYYNALIPTHFGKDMYISSLEVQPTAKPVVHHVLIWALPPMDVLKKEGKKAFQGLNLLQGQGLIGGYAPGNRGLFSDPGHPILLPKNATLLVQIHYNCNGSAMTDQTKLGFRFSPTTPDSPMKLEGIANVFMRIPANDPNSVQKATWVVPHDIDVHGFMAHTHLRGKTFRFDAYYPDGTHKVLLNLPTYNFNWQLDYRLNQPMLIPAGTKLVVTAVYDNSANNPSNPDHNKTVWWGDQTWDEMLLGYVAYTDPPSTAIAQK